MFWSIGLFRWYYIRGERDEYIKMKLIFATVTLWICVATLDRFCLAEEIMSGESGQDERVQENKVVEKQQKKKSNKEVMNENRSDHSKSNEEDPLKKKAEEGENSNSGDVNHEHKSDISVRDSHISESKEEGSLLTDQAVQTPVVHPGDKEVLMEQIQTDEKSKQKDVDAVANTDDSDRSSASVDELIQLGNLGVTVAMEAQVKHDQDDDKSRESLKSETAIPSSASESDPPVTTDQDVVISGDQPEGSPSPQLPGQGTEEVGKEPVTAAQAADERLEGDVVVSQVVPDEANDTQQPSGTSEEGAIAEKDDENLRPPQVDNAGTKSGDEEQPKLDAPGPDTDTDKEMEKAGKVKPHTDDDVIQVPESKDDELPSFDEWKQKMLAEQAEQEKSKTMEVQNPQTNGGSVTKTKGSKKVNYASATCGAKVRATNNEAQSPGFILSENKDQYMINPCKAKKWFTVELCTPVQIQALEIGNLELFSSLPESFVVHISEGYPTKDWKPLGTFHARDERNVQSFTVDGEQMYAHYIKVEMLSHYGTEHYCPLTVLRVYGLTVIEADEETEESVDEETGDLEVKDAEDQDSTLFHSATDTVMSLVKKVLNQGEEEEGSEGVTEEESFGDMVNLQDTEAVNASSAKNDSTKTPQTENQPLEPCVPDVSSSSSENGKKPENVKAEGDFLPKTPDINNKYPPTDESTGVEDERIVTLIQTPGLALLNVVAKCQFCQAERANLCGFDTQTICGYYRLWQFMPPTCCVGFHDNTSDSTTDDVNVEGSSVVQNPKADSVIGTENQLSKEVEVTATPVVTDSADSISLPDPQIDFSESSTFQPSAEEKLESSSTFHIEASLMKSPDAVASDTATPSLSGMVGQPSAAQTETDQVSSATEESFITPTEESCGNSDPKSSRPGCQVGPDVVQVRPTSTAEAEIVTPGGTPLHPNLPSENQEQIQSPPETDTKDSTASEENKSDKPDEDPSGTLSEGNGLKNIYAEDPTNGDAEPEPELAPVQGDDVQYQKLISGRKETTFMKLKNRIKDLELNLNLSSQYLEELSQRYRKQMEEMYSSLNKTITKLANTSRKAEERDLRQQEYITHLQGQINHLNSSIELLKATMADATMQVIERHLYLMLLEACIFLAVLAWCLHRQEKTVHSRGPRLSSEKSAINPSVARSPSVTRMRRNSVDATPPRDRASSSSALVVRKSFDDCDIRKSGSENDLSNIIPDTLQSTHLTGQWEICRKKKKKKNISSQKSLQFGHLVGQSLTNPASSHSYPSFSTDSSKTPGSSAQSSMTRKGQVQGHCFGKEPSSKDFTSHCRNGSGGSIKTSAVDQITSRSKSAKSLGHRKYPSFDRNIYNMLPVNGNAEDYGKNDGESCNGHTNECSSESSTGRFDGRR